MRTWTLVIGRSGWTAAADTDDDDDDDAMQDDEVAAEELPVETTLTTHFFGSRGKDVLTYDDFHRPVDLQ